MWKIKKGYEYVTKTFRIPEDMITKLEKLAHKNKLSLNQLVIQCLKFSIENIDDNEHNDIINNDKKK
jgi:predicted HicB family RNase H-like nuclease